MKNTILTLSLSLLFISSFAQKHLVGAIGGLNLSTLQSTGFLNNTDPILAPVVGFSNQYMVTERFSLGLDAIYDVRKFSEPINFLNWDEPYNMTYKLSYMSLPLKAGYNFGRQLYGFVNIGAVPSFLLSGTVTAPKLFNSRGVISEEVQDLKASTKRLDLSGLAEFGAGLKLSSIWVYTSLTYQHGLININSSDAINAREIVVHRLLFSLGVRYVVK
jgi:hypothetical protein